MRLMTRTTALFLLAFAPSTWANPPVVTEDNLRPEPRHKRAAEIILHIIDTYHYQKKALDDDLSGQILDNYLESLDANRSFFLAADIKNFERNRYLFDDALKDPDLGPAFEIFKVYRQRVDERVTYARQLLETEFDFSIDEDYRFDRRETAWAKTEEELNRTWRKKVKNDSLNLKLSNKDIEEIGETLHRRYTRLKTSIFQLDSNDVFQTFINAYTTSIEPHTTYFSPRLSENFDISMRLSLEGIGAVLRADYDYTVVQKVIPGGPAELSGQLESEDRIIGVGQDSDGKIIDVIGWRLDDVVDLIRGPKGSVVRLEILSETASPSKIIAITRDKIKLEEQAAKSEIIELERGGKVGVIYVPTFYMDFPAQARGDKNYRSTSRDVRRILAELKDKNIDGLIIDLRGNGGGSLAEALELTGLFIESGPIVQTRDSTGKIEINRDPDPDIAYGGPLAVLVDRNSASASEIFAGAIQDYRRGIITGEPTFGKGTVQNVIDLNRFVRSSDDEHGRLKTTIAQFFRISGGSNQHKGIIPDIVFPTARYNEEHGERILDNALPWDEVKPARYIPASAPVENFIHARELHEKRIKQDQLMQLLLDDLEIAHEADNRKVVTLLETRRKSEREKLLAAKKKLRDEFRAARGLEPMPEHIDSDKAREFHNEESEPLDVLLEETAQILFDLITPTGKTAMRLSEIPTNRGINQTFFLGGISP